MLSAFTLPSGLFQKCWRRFVTLGSYPGYEPNVPSARESHIQAWDLVKLVKTFHRRLWTVDEAVYKEGVCRLGDFISSQRALGIFAYLSVSRHRMIPAEPSTRDTTTGGITSEVPKQKERGNLSCRASHLSKKGWTSLSHE